MAGGVVGVVRTSGPKSRLSGKARIQNWIGGRRAGAGRVMTGTNVGLSASSRAGAGGVLRVSRGTVSVGEGREPDGDARACAAGSPHVGRDAVGPPFRFLYGGSRVRCRKF